MYLRTKARDCLYLNWALPRDRVPEPPPPLRYEVHTWQGQDWVFASALLFRLEGLHSRALPFLRLSYPQMNLRLYVQDAEGVPSVLFVRMMVPFWVAPVSRFVGRQPAEPGLFSYPGDLSGSLPARSPGAGWDHDDHGDTPDGAATGDSWTWSLRHRGRLVVRARLAGPRVGPGPALGGWQRTVDYIRRRPRGYVSWDGRLRSLEKTHPTVPVWPLAAELDQVGLLADPFAGVEADHWRRPHSAWVCPAIPFSFEVGEPELLPALGRRRRVAVVPDGA